MPRLLACLVLLLAPGLLPAGGPVPDTARTGKAASPQLQTEADLYAQHLLDASTQVSEHYVRPVERRALLQAALQGLYEAARVPIPAGLVADLKKASTEVELSALLSKARLSLGDAEPVRGASAVLVSCQAMSRTLDPHSGLVTGQELRRSRGVDDRQGVGIELEENEGVGPTIVKTVLPGSPAQVAGVRPGDEIAQLDGKPIKGMSSAQVQLLCDRGVPSLNEDSAPRFVDVTFRRAGAKELRRLSLERQELHPETVLGVIRQPDNSWDYLFDRKHKVGYVRLAALGNRTALEVREAVLVLQEAGMRGLVFDLRWCPGGYLREAVNVASLFLGDCTVVTVKGRTEETPYPSTRENKFLDFPMVALVNGETSGGAELIAAALQDQERAAIVGQRTLGKASIQTLLPLGVADGGLKLTTAVFVRKGGRNLHRFPESKPSADWGVRPDRGLEFRVSPDLNRQLRGWWLEQTLRPGTSREVLPLDDPSADAQRQAAVDVLLEKMKH